MSGKLVEMRGLAQIPLMIGLLIMAVAIPAVLTLVQQQQDKRSSAAGEVINGNVCSYSNVGAVDCIGNVVYFCSVGNDRLAYWQSSTDCTKTSQVCSRGSCVTPCSAAACTACTTSSACSAISSCTWGYVGSSLSCSKKTIPSCASQANSACIGNVATCTIVEGGVVVPGICSSGVCCKVVPEVVTPTTPTGSVVTPNTAACGDLNGQCATFSTALSTGVACSVGGRVGVVQTGLCGGGSATVCCKNGAGTAPVPVCSTANCSGNNFCDRGSHCISKYSNGSSCQLANECLSNICTGGRCVAPVVLPTYTCAPNGYYCTSTSNNDPRSAVASGTCPSGEKCVKCAPDVTCTTANQGQTVAAGGTIRADGSGCNPLKTCPTIAIVIPPVTYTCAANGNYCTSSDNTDTTAIPASGTCPSGQKCVNCAPAVVCTSTNQGQRVATGVRINADGSGCSKTCPAVTIFSSCNCSNGQAKKTGDANCDGVVTLTDFAIWSDEFTKRSTTTKSNFGCVSGRTSVELDDFAIWRDNFKGDL